MTESYWSPIPVDPQHLAWTLAMTSDQWYYCLDHQRVEPRKGCRADVRLGPYKTRDEAARALEKVEQRNLEWDNDPAWKDDDEE